MLDAVMRGMEAGFYLASAPGEQDQDCMCQLRAVYYSRSRVCQAPMRQQAIDYSQGPDPGVLPCIM
jgi:hypothetical protein